MADRDDRLLAAAYREWGKDARYTAPDGVTTTDCKVMFIQQGDPRTKRPIEGISFGGVHVGVAMGIQDLLVRISEVARPERGGVFQLLDASGQPISGESYEVGEDPMLHDVARKEWRCSVPFGDA